MNYQEIFEIAVLNSNSFETIIEMINEKVIDYGNSDDMAGQYAYISAKEGGYGTTKENIEFFLNNLLENGAKFNKKNAMKEALRVKNIIDNDEK